jgi:uncharacterized protein with WD repeat
MYAMCAGDIVFFNKLAKGNCKQMGKTRSGSSVTASWSPCGRYFLTATTAPRLRVDNNVRVFNYVGESFSLGGFGDQGVQQFQDFCFGPKDNTHRGSTFGKAPLGKTRMLPCTRLLHQ